MAYAEVAPEKIRLIAKQPSRSTDKNQQHTHAAKSE